MGVGARAAAGQDKPDRQAGDDPRQTRAIGGSAVIRLLVVAAVGSVTLISPDLNGAAVGVAAVGAAFLAETAILGWKVALLAKSTEALFPKEK